MKEEVFSMNVRQIMSKSVVTVSPNDTVEKAATLMKEHNIGSIPVCDNKQIRGIITDRDITLRSVAVGKDVKTQKISEVMTTEIITGSPNMDLAGVSTIMSQSQIRRLPIVENNTLVGIVALGDLATENKSDIMAGEALTSISETVK